jgi:hypothetical protein
MACDPSRRPFALGLDVPDATPALRAHTGKFLTRKPSGLLRSTCLPQHVRRPRPTSTMTRLLLPTVLVLAALLAGCASYTPRVPAQTAPAASDTFVYGRFHIDAPKAFMGLDGHASMGLGMKCSDGKEYLLRFYKDNPVHVIKVSPATCSVNEIVFTGPDGNIQGRKPFTGSVLQGMTFEPGMAHYVGDFFAVFESGQTSYRTFHTTWRIRDAKNEYAATTSDLRTQYAGLAGVATTDVAR